MEIGKGVRLYIEKNWATRESCGQEEPRASRMPEHLPSVDPTFLDGVREYAPDEKALGEKETP